MPFVNGIANLLLRNRWDTPFMQMNDYDLNRVFEALQLAGCHRVHTAFTDHGGVWGVALLAEKAKEPSL